MYLSGVRFSPDYGPRRERVFLSFIVHTQPSSLDLLLSPLSQHALLASFLRAAHYPPTTLRKSARQSYRWSGESKTLFGQTKVPALVELVVLTEEL